MSLRRGPTRFANENTRLLADFLVAGVSARSLLAIMVWGQVTASISGTVRDASGAVISDAIVTVNHTESGLVRTVATDSNGNYAVPSLPVGGYEETTEKPGFKRGAELTSLWPSRQ